jgi:hypothetical protein
MPGSLLDSAQTVSFLSALEIRSPSLSHVLQEGGIRFVSGCDTGILLCEVCSFVSGCDTGILLCEVCSFVSGCDTGILLCEVCSFSQLCKLHTGSWGGGILNLGGSFVQDIPSREGRVEVYSGNIWDARLITVRTCNTKTFVSLLRHALHYIGT